MLISDDLQRRIIDYYIEAGLDYAFWSKGFNMHFGYGGLKDICSREVMLNRMTEEVLKRLELRSCDSHLVDLGCGVGGSMRKVHAQFPELSVTGFTIVPWQKQQADSLHNTSGAIHKLSVRLEDYHMTSLENDSTDGLYAIESACYSPDHLQQRLFSEIHRVLKPGRKFVIADGFLKIPSHSLHPFIAPIYEGICKNWALPGMMDVTKVKELLTATGFKEIKFEEISWKVAPSVAHVPFVIARFLLSMIFQNKKVSQQSLRNLKGSFQTLLLGLHRKGFGYYLVSARK